MIVRSIAPLGITFAGGGTDIAEYSQEHGGAVMNPTINWYAHTHLAPAKEGIRLISLDFGTDEKLEQPPRASLREDSNYFLEGVGECVWTFRRSV